MKRVDVIVIGAGQAGLAMSRCLTHGGIEHVLLERGRVAERWRSERWDSLRLLTPRWQSRLPQWSYQGSDPDGFMSMPELIEYLQGYARSFAAPVEEGVTVRRVERVGELYRVTTDHDTWLAKSVVLATGDCAQPRVPSFAGSLDGEVYQVTPSGYRHPEQLPSGGVLVVGASASGVQLAEEIQRSGRPVTLAVGRHIRLPRSYRGKDIMWWLDRMGVMRESAWTVHDLEASRRQPSMQLMGSPDRRNIDLATLQDQGVAIVGRVAGVERHRVLLAQDLRATTDAAEAKLMRIRKRIDAFATAYGLDTWLASAPPPTSIALPRSRSSLDLRAEGIHSVVWATGFQSSHPWLRVPVISRGEIRHQGGVTPAPGLYVLGLRFMRRRHSNFIDGVGHDASVLSTHLTAYLNGARARAA